MNRDFSHTYWVAKDIISKSVISSLDNNYVFPFYLYPEEDGQQTLSGQPVRRPNLDMDIVHDIADGLGLRFVPEPDYAKASSDKKESRHSKRIRQQAEESKNLPKKDNALDKETLRQAQGDKPKRRSLPDERGLRYDSVIDRDSFAPIHLLNYIYAVLHSPTYRSTYKEFLKIDFPRVPYPADAETFWELVALGSELRQIHLLEHPVVDNFITTYPEAGSNEINYRLTKTQPGFIPYTKYGVHLEDGPHLNATSTSKTDRYPNEPLGKIQINKKQYFGNVPEKAWNFYIGGYQPAEKWLKDRRDRTLSVDEIRHYQKIIVALMETDRIMQKIDEIEID